MHPVLLPIQSPAPAGEDTTTDPLPYSILKEHSRNAERAKFTLLY